MIFNDLDIITWFILKEETNSNFAIWCNLTIDRFNAIDGFIANYLTPDWTSISSCYIFIIKITFVIYNI